VFGELSFDAAGAVACVGVWLCAGVCDRAGAAGALAGGVACFGGYLVADGAEGKGCCVASWATAPKLSNAISIETQQARMEIFIIAVADSAASPRTP